MMHEAWGYQYVMGAPHGLEGTIRPRWRASLTTSPVRYAVTLDHLPLTSRTSKILFLDFGPTPLLRCASYYAFKDTPAMSPSKLLTAANG